MTDPIKSYPEQKVKSAYRGDVWRAFKLGEDKQFPNNFVSRSLNGNLQAVVNTQQDLEVNAKLCEVTLQWGDSSVAPVRGKTEHAVMLDEASFRLERPVDKCRPTGNTAKTRSGVGMPASLYLQQFGDLINAAFGEVAYQVGSSLTGAVWRDIDVRVMLSKEQYEAMGFGDPKRPQENERWCAYVMAFSALGRQMTGLPIDFQIQERDTANAETDRTDSRSSLMMCAFRRQKEREAVELSKSDTEPKG